MTLLYIIKSSFSDIMTSIVGMACLLYFNHIYCGSGEFNFYV